MTTRTIPKTMVFIDFEANTFLLYVITWNTLESAVMYENYRKYRILT